MIAFCRRRAYKKNAFHRRPAACLPKLWIPPKPWNPLDIPACQQQADLIAKGAADDDKVGCPPGFSRITWTLPKLAFIAISSMTQDTDRIESILASQVIDLERSIRLLSDRDPSLPARGHPAAGMPAPSAEGKSERRLADRLTVLRYATRTLLDGRRDLCLPAEIRDSVERLSPDDSYLQFCERTLAHVGAA